METPILESRLKKAKQEIYRLKKLPKSKRGGKLKMEQDRYNRIKLWIEQLANSLKTS